MALCWYDVTVMYTRGWCEESYPGPSSFRAPWKPSQKSWGGTSSLWPMNLWYACWSLLHINHINKLETGGVVDFKSVFLTDLTGWNTKLGICGNFDHSALKWKFIFDGRRVTQDWKSLFCWSETCILVFNLPKKKHFKNIFFGFALKAVE